jgi:hypothetical protein
LITCDRTSVHQDRQEGCHSNVIEVSSGFRRRLVADSSPSNLAAIAGRPDAASSRVTGNPEVILELPLKSGFGKLGDVSVSDHVAGISVSENPVSTDVRRTAYYLSMNAGLKITYLYHDGDIIEVRIVAENASFRGSTDVYVGTDGLLEAAAVLEGFPKDRQDTREVVFGAAGPKFAGGSGRLKFYCKDGAGHTALFSRLP